MKKANAVMTVAMFLLFCGPAVALAANMPDFSGSYTLKSVKGEDSPGPGDALSLQIAQTDAEIKITTVTDGVPTTATFSLKNNGECSGSNSGDSKCSAQWNGKSLDLETVYTAHPTENGPDVEMHTRERLQLSSDKNTLTIKTETKAPQYPALEMAPATTEVYTRY
ncbi:MAG TPA: hypothetical protein VMB47_11070 [Candidatus Aquilonibacter sp.]|nr:hypothetical protein [Candidatus Aquilonibacter sp.]